MFQHHCQGGYDFVSFYLFVGKQMQKLMNISLWNTALLVVMKALTLSSCLHVFSVAASDCKTLVITFIPERNALLVWSFFFLLVWYPNLFASVGIGPLLMLLTNNNWFFSDEELFLKRALWLKQKPWTWMLLFRMNISAGPQKAPPNVIVKTLLRCQQTPQSPCQWQK